MIVDEDNYLAHYGILRKSGRYPWGSGGNIPQRSKTFLDYVKEMQKQGLSEAEIARGCGLTDEDGLTTTELRAAKTIARNQWKQHQILEAQRLKDKGYSNVAIGKRMEVPESTVRNLLKPGAKDKADQLTSIANRLREEVEKKGVIDIGSGVENQLGITKDNLAVAAAMLKESDGLVSFPVQVPQLGTQNKTITKVLTTPDVSYRDVASDISKIKSIEGWSEDGGRSWLGVHEPLSISSKRVKINYAEDGGDEADGVIYIRPGVDDISLGGSRYAQVRVAVDGSHYLKGMAMYKDDLPDGVDIVFNTNKAKADIGSDKLAAMKPLKTIKGTGEIDKDNPFGSMISRQIVEKDAEGNFVRVKSAMNIVNEEGSWEKWSKSLSSQVLSKQNPALANDLLAKKYAEKQAELDEIMALTNPAVRRKLLEAYGEDVDKLGITLKAKAMKGQGTHVLLPIKSMKDTEIYAPNYNDGDTVALIRYPHGGTFEIPELRVNNRQREAKKLLGTAPDAVGISSGVAKRLSGADFDGDTVLVIPNAGSRRLKTSPALEGLKNFDPQREYAGYEGMKKMSVREKELEMGRVSNLITDMTIRGAGPDDLARAVRHSMVVIDAEKHGLDWKESARRNGIPALMQKYQNKSTGGASTLISRAGSEIRVPKRKNRFVVDKETGEKIWLETGEVNSRTGKPITQKSKKLAETKDAHTLSSGTVIEKVYADHSNRMKALANAARKEAVNTKPNPYSPSARKHYKQEVDALDAKLNLAMKYRPLERQAQVIGNTTFAAKKAANPEMDHAEEKKTKSMALMEARARTGVLDKPAFTITDREWEAIQAGAVSPNKLKNILDAADLARVKELATPRTTPLMDSSRKAKAQALLATGHTQAEVAQALGISLTTLKTGMKED